MWKIMHEFRLIMKYLKIYYLTIKLMIMIK